MMRIFAWTFFVNAYGARWRSVTQRENLNPSKNSIVKNRSAVLYDILISRYVENHHDQLIRLKTINIKVENLL